MQNFFYSVPTEIYFGKGQIDKLGACLRQYGSKVLLVYGGGSIKKSGLYDKVLQQASRFGLPLYELSGVEPNPRLSTVRRGAGLCRENGIDLVLAVGGGSAIDCAKAVAAAAVYNGDPWDLVADSSLIRAALPVLSVLTLAATGSEMDHFAVISNPETNDKKGMGSPLLRPKVSILDPEYTYSVSPYQTAAGTADIISHLFELYFKEVPGAYMQKRMIEALLKTCVHYGPIAVKNPGDYDARANLMWASSWAINGFLSSGFAGPWSCHPMEHQLSACYDITHGVGLAILTPHWMRHILCDKTVNMFVEYGVNVWGISPDRAPYEIAEEAIARTEGVFDEMGIVKTLREAGVPDKKLFRPMAEKAVAGGLTKCYYPLQVEDVMKIYDMSF